jgi:hypothetical protein
MRERGAEHPARGQEDGPEISGLEMASRRVAREILGDPHAYASSLAPLEAGGGLLVTDSLE